jgi:nicotinamidase-related amidase
MEPEILSPAALVIVDMQNDFVRRGAPLEVPDAGPKLARRLHAISEPARALPFMELVAAMSAAHEMLLEGASAALHGF